MNRSLNNLTDSLRQQAQRKPGATAFTYLLNGEDAEVSFTYAELDRQARTLAAWLTAEGLAGERVLLLYVPGLEFITALYGCLYAGVIAVPAYPPDPSRLARTLPRLQAIVNDAQPALVMTTSSLLMMATAVFAQAPYLAERRWVASDDLVAGPAADWVPSTLGGETIAFIQYTSGSTAVPKGVVVSHGNALANLYMMRERSPFDADTCSVLWLPFYHDFGLILGILMLPFLGGRSVLMSPLDFLKQPSRWLRAIHTYRATVTASPNFALDLCARKVTPAERATLDLSSLQVAVIGAEPLHHETLQRFMRTFAPCGFNSRALVQAYGLAEAVLGASYGSLDRDYTARWFRTEALATGTVEPCAQDAEGAQVLVSSGWPIPDQRVEIVDPDTGTRCPPERVGEIWLAGPNIARGYWSLPAESAATFAASLSDTGEGPFLRTGDLGFFHDGELFVTGRRKDLIIIHGRNLYPQDIELTVERCHPMLRPSCVAAFSLASDDGEALVVVAEVDPRSSDPAQLAIIAAAIRDEVGNQHMVRVTAVALVKARSIPKTSSGKIQRKATRAAFLDGSLLLEALWQQPASPMDDGSTDVAALLEAPTADPLPSSAAGDPNAITTASIQEWLVQAIAEHCRISAPQVDGRASFYSFGLDSVAMVDLSGRLERWLRRPIVPAVLYDHPTIERLARYLACPPNQGPADLGASHAELRPGEPIAIVGMACRFPGGADTPETFWENLVNGVDAVTPIPPDRFAIDGLYDPDPDVPGRTTSHRGAFVAGVDRFDAPFFQISRREAERIDPQQRLLLEVAWEALERVGIRVESLEGSRTGVFMGLSNADYAQRHLTTRELDQVDAWSAVGSALSVAAGRISYVMGLQGPSLTVDTACSSSLTAVQLAVQSLQSGACELALAGGVNLVLAPNLMVALSKARMLAPDGRCKTFDDAADGYVRGEGCGVVVLKRLADAVRDRDPVLAVVRGAAANHDGRSNGLTAPSGSAQQMVIGAALGQSGVRPQEVGYVEAHGTGTRLGDPIELGALNAALGAGRSGGGELLVGSVKTNIGHLESAAGIAGLIKTVLALQHGELPPSLHFQTPNRHVPWDQLALRVTAQRLPWPGRRVAGVSSFGFSGTNVHVVLEQGPATELAEPAPARSAELFVLSARTAPALQAMATQLAQHLDTHSALALADVAFSLAMTRSAMTHRLAIAASSREELQKALAVAAPTEAGVGTVAAARGKLAFLFTGQGAQVPGMGRALCAEWPAFRAELDRCVALFDQELDRPLREVMWAAPGSADAALLDQTLYTQPALFVIEHALVALWRSWGVEPDFVAGHSIGELTAACVAGVFCREDAVRLVAARARLMQALPATGAMVSIAASEQAVAALVAPYQEAVSIAAVNGPLQVVISGDEQAVLAIAAECTERRVHTRRLRVSHAFHSPTMQPMLAAFSQVAESIVYQRPSRPLISNLSGNLDDGETATPDYWVRHVREAVRFAAGVKALHAAGATTFLEVGPRSTLLRLIPDCLPEAEPTTLIASLRAGSEESASMLAALGSLWSGGSSVTWTGVFPAGGRRVLLPTYPWQRQRYWLEAPEAAEALRGARTTSHPLLGRRVPVAGSGAVFESVLGLSTQAWLGDHKVAGQIVVPGAALAELLLAAARAHAATSTAQLSGLVFQAPLVLPELGSRRIQVVLSEKAGEAVSAQLYSQPATSGPDTDWTVHAQATVAREDAEPIPLDLATLQARCSEALDLDAVYSGFAAVGLTYGPAFQGLRSLWRGQGESLARVELPVNVAAVGYGIHPALIDAAFHAIVAALAPGSAGLRLPFAIGSFTVHRPWAEGAWVHVRVHGERRTADVVADVTLTDAAGLPVAEITELRLQPLDSRALVTVPAEPFYVLDWHEAPLPTESVRLPAESWIVVAATGSAVARALAAQLGCQAVITPAELGAALAGEPKRVVCLWEASSEPGVAAQRVAAQGLTVVQALRSRPPARLRWVTMGAVPVESGDDVAVATAALWGLGRTVMQEHPEFGCTLVDLDPGDSGLTTLLRELAASDGENQVAWRASRRLVARMVPAKATDSLPDSADCYLQTRRKGTLDALHLAPAERRTPGAGEVEIEVRAAGLNFRDVLNALDMYPGDAGPLGSECAGVVVGIGEGTSGLSVGDAVMALAGGSFRRFVTVDARLVVAIPSGLSFEQAATVPIAFLTAWYALNDLAKLQPGERLLVHAAAGGVGMAAVQLGQWLGAEVVATASPAKWDAVRSLGVTVVANSRTLEFATALRPQGVDVVLNALAGEFVDASLSLLSAGGRLLEMGKTDARAPAAVAASHPGVRYRAFDLWEAGPQRIAEMLVAISAALAAGHLRPLPVRTFPLTQAEAAFRLMGQARHVGKLALLPPTPSRCGSASTVVLTGGLGALGRHVARWLAKRGVGQLILTGRRGLDTPDAAAVVAELAELGVQVKVAAVDVTDRAALVAMLRAIPPELPLRGVIHAAGVLDDGLLVEQTAERFARVLRPKVEAAWNLHELTRGQPLDFFIVFSSMAGLLGSAGQGSYAAANSFLDALAAHRRASGLPAQSLAWGPWSQGGMATELAATQRARLSRHGIGSWSPDQGIALLAQAVARPEAHLGVVSLDRRALSRALGAAIPPLWQALVSKPLASHPAASGPATWTSRLAALPAEQRTELVHSQVQSEVARVLSLGDASAVPTDRPLAELGLDSLMATELRNALGRWVGTTLPATLAFDYPTVDALTNWLLSKLPAVTAAKAPSVTAAPKTDQDEPIAIVGIGCRYPGGVHSPETFWQLLQQGTDAITEVPATRWDAAAWYDPDPDAPGKMTTRWGGFIPDLERFDPAFFNISPREAKSIDPQERMLLEASWEALERAGQTPERLFGSNTAVYMGLCGTEYQSRSMTDAQSIDTYALLGTAHSAMVGRLSYFFGLNGPNLAVDTACSSSLVAVHLACQALRQGECQMALAGGANVVLTPEGTVYFSRLHAMSPTGRCHSFDAAADGYVRSEGCGVVVLKRLTDAQRAGDPILAVIRGSAVNQDGRSNGLTAPSGAAQEAVIRRALEQADVLPREIDYVECHGTGTVLGDPIEVMALGAVLGEGRPLDQPVMLGSVKTNFGHTEGAAGVAGLIKAVLAIEQGQIPKSLHFTSPNPYIPWAELPVQVVSEPVPWPARSGTRRAGVSSFGFSGTNAHVVLEQAPESPLTAAAPERPAELYVISAKSEAALGEASTRLAEHLQAHPQESLTDVAYSLGRTRSPMEHRLAVVACSREQLHSALSAAAQGKTAAGLVRGTQTPKRGKLAWLFPGQGAQQPDMGRQLCALWPEFCTAFDRCVELFDAHLDRSLRAAMWAQPGTADAQLLNKTSYTQPALFTLEYALSALWQSWGVNPEMCCGHSLGEIVAACICGVFSLEDAVMLVAGRGRLMQGLTELGAMLSLGTAEELVAASVKPYAAEVAIAAVNAPQQVVISGAQAPVQKLEAEFAARGVRTKRLKVSHAFHSPLMEPMLEEFRKVAERVKYKRPRIELISNVRGKQSGEEVGTAEYWVRHVREPVRFAAGVEAMRKGGARSYLEVGPGTTLLSLVAEGNAGEEAALVASLREGKKETESLLQALGEMWTKGEKVRWEGVFGEGGKRVALPSYPWQRQRHWIAASAKASSTPAAPPEEALSAAALRRLCAEGTLSPAALAAVPELLAALSAQRALAAPVAQGTYTLTWREVATPAGVPDASGRWVVLADLAAERESLCAALTRFGGTPIGISTVAELSTVLARELGLKGVLCVTSLQAGAEGTVLAVLKQLAAFGSGAPRAFLLTRGAVSTGPTDPPQRPEQAVIWGLGRSFALEQPRIWGALLDRAADPTDPAEADLVVALITGASREDQLALRAGLVFGPRVVPYTELASRRPFHTAGTVLLTGGLGGLGMQVARWLAGRGVRRLLLTGRRGLATPGAAAAITELQALGTTVHVAAADVTDEAAMRTALQALPASEPLTAVFHAAGVVDTTAVDALTTQRLDEVLAAKREGTRILEALTQAYRLDAFVCFSSIAGVWGAGRQAAYAAANAFLDAWAQSARAGGLPAIAVAWGPWAGEGMINDAARAHLTRSGLRSLPPEQALQALEQALAQDAAHVVVADVDWAVFRESFEAWGARPVLSALASPPGPPADSAAGLDLPEPAGHPLAETLAVLRPFARESHLRDWLVSECCALLGHPAATQLDPHAGFFDLGMDSLMAVQLRKKLKRDLGLDVAASVIFDYPNIAALTAKLLAELGLVADRSVVTPPVTADVADRPWFDGSDEDALKLIAAKFEELV